MISVGFAQAANEKRQQYLRFQRDELRASAADKLEVLKLADEQRHVSFCLETGLQDQLEGLQGELTEACHSGTEPSLDSVSFCCLSHARRL